MAKLVTLAQFKAHIKALKDYIDAPTTTPTVTIESGDSDLVTFGQFKAQTLALKQYLENPNSVSIETIASEGENAALITLATFLVLTDKK